MMKRAFDATLSGIGLTVSSPLWLLIAVAIKLQDGGPIFFPQARVGRDGRVFKALKFRSRTLMMEQWKSLHPTPEYYAYPCRRDPHPFMGLDKFIAGRLHQMGAHKSYLAAHPSWWSEDPDTSCPRCRSGEETFEHAILHSLARFRLMDRYLEPTLAIHADSPLWDNKEHLQALSQYLSATRTGFPPEMAPSPLPSPAPSRAPSPLSPHAPI